MGDEGFLTCFDEKVFPAWQRVNEHVSKVFFAMRDSKAKQVVEAAKLWKTHLEAAERALESCPMPSDPRLMQVRTYGLGGLREYQRGADCLVGGVPKSSEWDRARDQMLLGIRLWKDVEERFEAYTSHLRSE